MRKFWSVLALLGGLAACGNPLSQLDDLGDVDLSDAPATQPVLPSEAEVAREGYIGTQAAEPTGQSEAAAVQAAAQTTAAASPATAAPKRAGLRGILDRVRGTPPEDAVVPASAPAGPADGEAAVEATAAAPETTETAALTPQAQAPQTQAALQPAAPAPKRRGLFGLGGGNTNTPASPAVVDTFSQDVSPGATVAFGAVGRACGIKGRALGKKVAKAPARGFALHDTAPGTLGPRTYFLTGFADGCARQFTAATITLGDAATYEQFRFGPGAENLPFGETDRAYAKIKRKVCGVGRKKPCGTKIKALSGSTFFVTSYRDLGHTGTWSEVLVHDGAVAAVAMKSHQ